MARHPAASLQQLHCKGLLGSRTHSHCKKKNVRKSGEWPLPRCETHPRHSFAATRRIVNTPTKEHLRFRLFIICFPFFFYLHVRLLCIALPVSRLVLVTFRVLVTSVCVRFPFRCSLSLFANGAECHAARQNARVCTYFVSA